MRVISFLVLIILAPVSIFALGSREKGANQTARNTMTIVGKVQIYGSSPHTFVGIAAKDGTEYAVYPPEQAEKLRKLQGHLIEFTVILLGQPQSFEGLVLRGGTVTPLSWRIIQ
ncbi:MAG: hypothetical protein FWC36_07095 [Spirochaetes bacterium]|nr:hypothetical protein [Spirochaetota bacterium]